MGVCERGKAPFAGLYSRNEVQPFQVESNKHYRAKDSRSGGTKSQKQGSFP